MSDHLALIRQLWHLVEPIHAALYYAPQAFDEAARLGFDVETRWPSYFAWRAAPLGSAGPRLVAASFYSFSPHMVAEHVPQAWSVAAPATVLEARLGAVDATLLALLGDDIAGAKATEAARLLRQAAEAADTAGRPLAAANADLPWPSEPHLQLWQAATVLREHRGDGHVAALIAAGLGPCESLVSFAAVGAAPVEVFASRGWSHQQWADAQARLVERGWVDARGCATEAGLEGRAALERHTDQLAARPWNALGSHRCQRLAQLVGPWTKAVATSGMLPRQSTLGIGRGPNGADAQGRGRERPLAECQRR